MLGLAAPDKFRGSATARDVARAVSAGLARCGWDARGTPLADGGEGTLDAFGGPNRHSVVSGPLGLAVEAAWRLENRVAVIEAARASGLDLTGGARGNDPLRASTRGTGELIAAALAAGAERVIVGVGGSASTDGGLGAIEALGAERFPIPVQVACDVRTPFLDAASVFGPQKGASSNDVRALTERLRALAERYRKEFGVDVTGVTSAGAAGGLAGGLAALGAELVPGFDFIAGRIGLDDAIAAADLVVTGEGKLDATSFAGKVVGGVIAACERLETAVLVIAGEIAAGTVCPVPAVSLIERFGRDEAWSRTTGCVSDVVAAYVQA
ncbi:MAG TPA: glycerate kinase [Gaiellaceae bacterium]